ncbi:type II toxin-antitoxin system RelE/ParE family toxin [Vibrio sp. 99-8-1]|uniref:type II toxin-antitoxin system RelE/ParE family toxin n=1 Tax=Vibrio sp. 99-8-1 TaxID=2607602 RepID=UPI00149332BD|nr:type II toxin-antitoxin system RelE/ParE family toxin [Vibrio sp. 99-8-1]NOI65951.1 type II toxin-antitoxin system RelE/ParE family toxin [Vibrio sp. 99-8-1]
MNKKSVTIEVAETFDKKLDNAITHLSLWSDELEVVTKVDSVLDTLETQAMEQPYSYSRCPELVELGVNFVRNANIGNFRLLYEIYESEQEIKVTLLLFIRTNQSVEKQLVEYCLYQ